MENNDPQKLLNQIHEIRIPDLYISTLSVEERENAISLANQKLSLVKKRLKQEINLVKSAYDGRKKREAGVEERELKPYLLLDDLIDQIEIALAELKMGSPNAQPPEIGDRLEGGFGSWEIVSNEVILQRELRDLTNKTKNAVQVAAGELKRGYAYTSIAILLKAGVLLIDIIWIINLIASWNISFLIYVTVLTITYALIARIFLVKVITNAPEKLQRLQKAKIDLSKIVEAGEDEMTLDSSKMEIFRKHLHKIESFAKHIADG